MFSTIYEWFDKNLPEGLELLGLELTGPHPGVPPKYVVRFQVLDGKRKEFCPRWNAVIGKEGIVLDFAPLDVALKDLLTHWEVFKKKEPI